VLRHLLLDRREARDADHRQDAEGDDLHNEEQNQSATRPDRQDNKREERRGEDRGGRIGATTHGDVRVLVSICIRHPRSVHRDLGDSSRVALDGLHRGGGSRSEGSKKGGDGSGGETGRDGRGADLGGVGLELAVDDRREL
jgi:hypothetical protein